jgi:putative chitinase
MSDPRAPLWAFIRGLKESPAGRLAQDDVDRGNLLLDELGARKVPEEPVGPRSAPSEGSGASTGLRDQDAFWAHVRASLFGGTISDQQFAGMSAILKVAGGSGFPIAWTAYALATAYHETARSMFPNRESLNYSVEGLINTFGRHRISVADARRLGRSGTRPADQVSIGNIVYGGPWGKDNLGNTEPGDGYKYRGGGMDHCTGRANFAKVDAALNLGGRLVADPDIILDPEIAAGTLISGLETGRYRGIKISDRVPRDRLGETSDFTDARPIINPDRNGAMIAGHALKFQAGLAKGGWA